MTRRVLAVASLAALVAGQVVSGQSVGLEAGRLLATPDWSSNRVGYGGTLVGPLGFSIYGVHLGQAGTGDGSLWGPGGELSLFRRGAAGPYLVTGLSGGLAAGDGERFWASWTAGLGYELQPVGPFQLGAEGRWREIRYSGETSGLEFAVQLGILFPGSGAPARPRTAPPTTPERTTPPPLRTTLEAAGAEPARIALLESVLETARGAMGTPYRWGGTGQGGFDCSGLIQYAYGEHGIALPRRSVDQAREGRAVRKEVSALLPGDILTFSNSGGPVTHVGLYLGDRQFIHSASDGVQISLLSEDDAYGRWWWRRWIGARRVVPEL